MSKRFAFRVFTAVLILFVSAAAPAISVKTEMVPMRDGTKLATDIGLPDGDGPWPTIMIRTPYSKPSMYATAALAVQHGYACAVQDMRGRFDSEGEDYPVFLHDGWGEHQDGYDTVEWIAAQEWSNGKVGGFGISAPGIALNMLAPSRPRRPTETTATSSPAQASCWPHRRRQIARSEGPTSACAPPADRYSQHGTS